MPRIKKKGRKRRRKKQQKQHPNEGDNVEAVEKKNIYSLMVSVKTDQPLWKLVWRFLKKLKIGLP